MSIRINQPTGGLRPGGTWQTNYRAGKNDGCQTPFYALTPLLPYLGPSWLIWEPAAGKGFLATALRDAGHKVIDTDINAGRDFLRWEPEQFDAIVTNPPWSKTAKYAFIDRCCRLGKPWALLMPIQTISSKTGTQLAEQLELILINPRPDFMMPIKGWIKDNGTRDVAWFTCGLNIGQQLTPGWIVKPDGNPFIRA